MFFDVNIHSRVEQKQYNVPLQLGAYKTIKIFHDFFTGELKNFGKDTIKIYVLFLFNYVVIAGMVAGKIFRQSKYVLGLHFLQQSGFRPFSCNFK